MKKGKFIVLGLIALVLAGGLVLASCDTKCEGSCGYISDNCYDECNGASICKCKDGYR